MDKIFGGTKKIYYNKKMTPDEKKAFVARMKKGKKDAAKALKKQAKRGGVNPKSLKKVKADLKKLDPKKDWYNEYKRLGGKKSKKQFLKNVNIFMDHTFDIFIHGDPEKYKTRNAALMGAKQAANIDKKELDLIFHSIDNVTAYT